MLSFRLVTQRIFGEYIFVFQLAARRRQEQERFFHHEFMKTSRTATEAYISRSNNTLICFLCKRQCLENNAAVVLLIITRYFFDQVFLRYDFLCKSLIFSFQRQARGPDIGREEAKSLHVATSPQVGPRSNNTSELDPE